MNPASAQLKRLGDYAEDIYYKGNKQLASRSPHRPFNNSASGNTPALRKYGMNRILLFPGSFNPPHEGHKALLRYVKENAGEDLHIVAAIVLPTDDQRLEDKTSEDENPLVLTKEQRVNLWRGQNLRNNWVWIYDQSEPNWAKFKPTLEKNIRKDGFDFKFILLGGPDWIGNNGIVNVDPRYWGCTECITSDISRPADIRCPSGLRQLSSHSNWEKVEFDRHSMALNIKERMHGHPEEVIQKQVILEVERHDAQWVCYRVRKPKGMVRFIAGKQKDRATNPPSSSLIRQLINTTAKEKLRGVLMNVVLNPDILVKYVSQRPPAPPRRVKVQPPEPTAEELAWAQKKWDEKIQW
ncbi:Fc.00g096730.m01.CDS01 [Cosmosporella sp. VM-42]